MSDHDPKRTLVDLDYAGGEPDDEASQEAPLRAASGYLVAETKSASVPSKWEETMSEDTREKYLKIALVVFGVIFLLIYPLALIWPSGWIWHGGRAPITCR